MEPIYQGESLWPPIKAVTKEEFNVLPDDAKTQGLYAVLDDGIDTVGSGNIYSTEETVIGRWIDGKPLYRKVFYDNSTPVLNLNGILLVENVNFLVKQHGVIAQIISGSDSSLSLYGFPYSSDTELIITKLNSNNELTLFVSGNWPITYLAQFSSTPKLLITIEYYTSSSKNGIIYPSLRFNY